MTRPPPVPHQRRAAVLLSAFVCPGAGQWVQRRWWPGLLYAASFLACVIAAGFALARVAVQWWERLAYATGTLAAADAPPISVSGAFLPLGLALVVYVVNVVDVVLAQRRRAHSPSASS